MPGNWGTERYMTVCPNGHDSQTGDVCAVCGAPIAAAPATAPGRVVGKHHAGAPRPAGDGDDTCPWCGNPSPGQFCARCGFRVRGPLARQPGSQSQPEPEPEPQPESQSEPGPQPESQPFPAPEHRVSASSPMTSWSAVPPSPPAPASGVTGAPSGPPDSLFPPASQPDPLAPAARSQSPEFRDWFSSPRPPRRTSPRRPRPHRRPRRHRRPRPHPPRRPSAMSRPRPPSRNSPRPPGRSWSRQTGRTSTRCR